VTTGGRSIKHVNYGIGVKAEDVPNAVFFVVSPEKRLDRAWRLYPRNFRFTG
jgi:hypothetical protein